MGKKEIEHFNETVKSVLTENNLFVTQKYLYHYTDIYGLEGIIKNKELWLSERNYMNDINDEKFIHDYIKHYFKNPINWKGSLLERELIPQKNQYIFSTSTEKDLINQWAYYGSQQSFCLEIDRKKLIDLFYHNNNETDYYYGPVLYAENDFKKDNKIIKIIDGIISKYTGIILEDIDNIFEVYSSPDKKEQYRQVFQYFYSLIKQYGHYCEHEYRFTLQNSEKPNFRIRKGLFVPYLKIPFETENLISRIIIGPNNKEDFTERNLKYFLNQNGLNKIEISKSKMKIR